MVKWIFVFLIVVTVLFLYVHTRVVKKNALVDAWGKHSERLLSDDDDFEKYFTVTFYYYGYYRLRGYEVIVSPIIHESQAIHLIGESKGFDLFDAKGRKI